MSFDLQIFQAILQGGSFALIVYVVVWGIPWAVRAHNDAVSKMQDRWEKRHEQNLTVMRDMGEAIRKLASASRRDRDNPDRGPRS